MKTKRTSWVLLGAAVLAGGCCSDDYAEEARQEQEARDRIAWRTWYRQPSQTPIVIYEPPPEDPLERAVYELSK